MMGDDSNAYALSKYAKLSETRAIAMVTCHWQTNMHQGSHGNRFQDHSLHYSFDVYERFLTSNGENSLENDFCSFPGGCQSQYIS